MRHKTHLPFRMVLLFLVIIFLSLSLGFYVGTKFKSETPDSSLFSTREIRGGGKYTNPLLECELNQTIAETEYKPSKSKVQSFIDDKIKQGEIQDVAVYYRDLNNGPWFGINEKHAFSPSSLLKVPVMMAYFKLAEENSGILTSELEYKKLSGIIEPAFIPANSLEEGKKYTVDKLIEQMIVYSDNDALFILEENIATALIDKVTQDLGIETAVETTPEDYMSVKSYASLFRILYNASYLNKDFSEKALELMDKVHFGKGITQGIPNNIVISNKFGERELASGVKQLHDCGVVYYTKRPYLLCVMTRGKDYQKLSEAIGKISSIIYSDLDQRYSEL